MSLNLRVLFDVVHIVQDRQAKINDYGKRATVLVKWIKQMIVILDNREFPQELWMLQV